MRPKRLGIVANEFHATELGRMGGFGWGARAASDALARQWPGTATVFLSCEHRSEDHGAELEVHGRRLVTLPPEGSSWRERLRDEALDALLTIDFRPSYLPLLEAVRRRPTVVWVRDPRTRADVERIGGLDVPGLNGEIPGVRPVDCTDLGRLLRPRALGRRPRTRLATVAPRLLSPKAEAAYGTPGGTLPLLPNPVEPPGAFQRAEEPAVVFLGRLDPIKRPWAAVEVARRLPDVHFDFLGKAHFDDAWTPDGLPPNVRMLGHLDGEPKRRILGKAWALLNTSIHEALPVSLLEALAAETPVVACLDPEGIVSRFGAHVGWFGGDGMDAVPAFEHALRELLARPERVAELGRGGRLWVESTHTSGRFAAALETLLAR